MGGVGWWVSQGRNPPYGAGGVAGEEGVDAGLRRHDGWWRGLGVAARGGVLGLQGDEVGGVGGGLGEVVGEPGWGVLSCGGCGHGGEGNAGAGAVGEG